jgi:TRAP-type C4-dicarboxylate transport system substrate-binding protein
MKGLKIRVPEIKFLIDFWNEVGTVNTPISFPELAPALQQKLVDGQEVALASLYPASVHEFNKFLTRSNHSYNSLLLLCNKETWNSLTPQQQKDLQAAYDYACQWQIDYCFKQYEEWEKDITASGGSIIDPDPSLFEDFKKIGVKLLSQQYYQDCISPEIRARMYPEYFK